MKAHVALAQKDHDLSSERGMQKSRDGK